MVARTERLHVRKHGPFRLGMLQQSFVAIHDFHHRLTDRQVIGAEHLKDLGIARSKGLTSSNKKLLETIRSYRI